MDGLLSSWRVDGEVLFVHVWCEWRGVSWLRQVHVVQALGILPGN